MSFDKKTKENNKHIPCNESSAQLRIKKYRNERMREKKCRTETLIIKMFTSHIRWIEFTHKHKYFWFVFFFSLSLFSTPFYYDISFDGNSMPSKMHFVCSSNFSGGYFFHSLFVVGVREWLDLTNPNHEMVWGVVWVCYSDIKYLFYMDIYSSIFDYIGEQIGW